MVLRRSNTLEPLLVPTLRLLVAIPLAVILAQGLIGYFVPLTSLGFVTFKDVPTGVALPFIIAEALTLFLLLVPQFSIWFGKWYLPVTLFTCTLGPASSFFLLLIRFQADIIQGTIPSRLAIYGFQGVMPMVFFLLIPLIVIAWQYSFRQVLFYVIGLAVIEVGSGIVVTLVFGVNVTVILLQFAVSRTVVFLANGYLVSRLVASQRQQRAALATANEQLARYALTQEQLAVSQERNRLARDLHDTLAHYISGLVLELEGTRLLWDRDSAEARATLDDAIGTARTGLVETRRALQALRSTPLVDLGLCGAIRELAENAAARNDWQLQLNLPATPVVLPAMVEEVIYRVVQEGLTNIERHAEATVVTLSMTTAHDSLQLRLADNGCGFTLDAVNRDAHFGITGMQERTNLVAGTLQVESAVGCGTKVSLCLEPTTIATDIATDRQAMAPQVRNREKEISQ